MDLNGVHAGHQEHVRLPSPSKVHTRRTYKTFNGCAHESRQMQARGVTIRGLGCTQMENADMKSEGRTHEVQSNIRACADETGKARMGFYTWHFLNTRAWDVDAR